MKCIPAKVFALGFWASRTSSWIADAWDALFGRYEPYYRVELDGCYCIVPVQDVDAYPPSGGYTVTPTIMTRRQVAALPEFDGF